MVGEPSSLEFILSSVGSGVVVSSVFFFFRLPLLREIFPPGSLSRGVEPFRGRLYEPRFAFFLDNPWGGRVACLCLGQHSVRRLARTTSESSTTRVQDFRSRWGSEPVGLRRCLLVLLNSCMAEFFHPPRKLV